MERSRLARYQDKIELVRRRADQVIDWSNGFKLVTLKGDEKTTLAIYKAFQEIVEALMDMCSMILTDSGTSPRDDYWNIDRLQELNVISKEMGGGLIGANGLRNWIVHRYNLLDDALALSSMKDLHPLLLVTLEEIVKWLSHQE